MAARKKRGVPYQRSGSWCGHISISGRKYWVGTFPTKAAWEDAAAQLRMEVRSDPLRSECRVTMILWHRGIGASVSSWSARCPARCSPVSEDVRDESLARWLIEGTNDLPTLGLIQRARCCEALDYHERWNAAVDELDLVDCMPQ